MNLTGTGSEIRVQTISDYSSFLDLEPAWNNLVQEAGIDHPFLEHAWLRTWWECFAGTSRLHVLVARAGEELVGIAPLIRDEAWMSGVRVRRLGFFFNPHVPRADFIVAQPGGSARVARSSYSLADGWEENVCRALWTHLLERSDWDLLQLSELRVDSAIGRQLQRLAVLDGCHVGAWRSTDAPYVPMATSWEKYRDSLPRKHRNNLRNRLKRLEVLGPVDLESVVSAPTLDDCLEAGFRLEASSWKKKAGTAIACDQQIRRFYGTFAHRAAKRGWLQLHFLRVGGKRIAFDYSLLYKNTLHLLKLGYDPAYSTYSPCNLMLNLVLQSAFDRGVGRYEFLGANEGWKQVWTRQTEPQQWLFVFRDSLRARIPYEVKFRLVPLLRQYPFYGPLRDLAVRRSNGRLVRRAEKRSSERLYVSAWPGLTPGNFFPSKAVRQPPPFPLDGSPHLAFCVARSGIYQLFRALRFQPGETVLVPDYHSGNEVFAIRAAGVPITYYPIRRNLEPDLDVLSRLAAQGPRALYVIHYLGWPQPMEEIAALCRERGMLLIEDCALSLLSEAGGQPLGRRGAYSIFCLYKTLPVPNGGLLVMNDGVPPGLDELHLEPCPATAAARRTAELMLEALRSRSNRLGGGIFALKRAAGRALRAAGAPRLPVGDIGWNPADVNVGMSALSNTIMRGLDYEQVRKRRRENFLALRERLDGRVEMLREDLPEGVCPLFFPIVVKDKSRAARDLWQRGIGAVEFWNQGDPAAVGHRASDAQYLRDHVLELPVHQGVTAAQAEYVAEQVRRLDL